MRSARPVLRTERIQIFEAGVEDVEHISEEAHDKESLREFQDALAAGLKKELRREGGPPEEVVEFLRSMQAERDQVYGGWDRAGELVAFAAVREASGRTPELELTVAKPFQRQGYGKEFVAAWIPWLFSRMEVECFLYRLRFNNHASQRLARWVGAVRQAPRNGIEQSVLYIYHVYPPGDPRRVMPMWEKQELEMGNAR